MKILISNDDGIDSRGIYALAQELKKIGDILVVAPRTEQSAVGHAITMKIPVRVTEYFHNSDFFGYAVDGTPADCIKMGIKNILKTLPDIVVSGINNGANSAINIIYSGTVSAAREAAIMDVPSIAVSIASHDPNDYSFAAKIAAKTVITILKNKVKTGTLLNVNIPNIPESEIKGIKFTSQGKTKWDDVYEERIDPYGKKYFWLTGKLTNEDLNVNSDHAAVLKNYVSISPIHFDLTDYEMLEKMKEWDTKELL
ncbi:MAG: 5'/3'-nucleotidase SurE [Ignavibacteriales bacterium CG_4_9_14_3_um_filter_34_10]|nr:MAG: 5'/3'-nucleotidase SurE [Ignavibacteriales bacterium CG_4_9_14_3_um_filter_34_10]